MKIIHPYEIRYSQQYAESCRISQCQHICDVTRLRMKKLSRSSKRFNWMLSINSKKWLRKEHFLLLNYPTDICRVGIRAGFAVQSQFP